MMAYTRRLRPKGVLFSPSRFHKLRYIKGQGNRLFRYLKGPLIIIFRIGVPYG